MSDNQKKILLSFGQITVASIIAGACTVGAWLWVSGGRVAVAQSTIEDHSTRIAVLEVQFRKDHDILIGIQSDVKWITKSLGKKD